MYNSPHHDIKYIPELPNIKNVDNEDDSNNNIYNNLVNKTYIWENSLITFLNNFKMNAFGLGICEIINSHDIIAEFGGRIHYIKFNQDFTAFTSIRQDDSKVVFGTILL